MTNRLDDFLAVAKALGDETRLRAFLSLRKGELCLCQIVQLLGLAPSTVSRHMSELLRAGLVERRRDGRWQYYRMRVDDAPPLVKGAVRWALRSLDGDERIAADAEAVARIRSADRAEASRCY